MHTVSVSFGDEVHEIKPKKLGTVKKPIHVRLPFRGDTKVEVIQRKPSGSIDRTLQVAQFKVLFHFLFVAKGRGTLF